MLKQFINYIKDKDYVIAVYKDKIYIYNYNNIIDISSSEARLTLNDKKIKIKGNELCAKKLENHEILIEGKCKEIEFYD